MSSIHEHNYSLLDVKERDVVKAQFGALKSILKSKIIFFFKSLT